MKTISIVTPCYNEEDNVREVVRRTREVMKTLGRFEYEHIFIDNASKDSTVAILRELASEDARVKIIVNARNFGHLRSPVHGMYQASGDVVFLLLSDLQDPPELLIQMVEQWELGYPVVLGIKTSSEESGVMYRIRTAYYRLIRRLTDIETFEHFTGFGLYDRIVIDTLKTRFKDPYPYFRGMIAETGYGHISIPYNQKRRERGITKNNFYTLYDLAMLGIINLSKIPLRFATFVGFACAGLSILVGLFYLVYKLLFWNNFTVGIAPIAIGAFFFISVQLVCLGILGEYIGAIYTQVQNRPLVIEKERVNFGPPERRNALSTFSLILTAALLAQSGFVPKPVFDQEPPVLPATLKTGGVLIFSKTNGYRDEPAIQASNAALAAIAMEKGWPYFLTENGAVMTAEILSKFRLVIWNNASGDVLTSEQRAAFKAWVENGGSYLGIHGAGGDPVGNHGHNSLADWNWYVDTLVGAQFVVHSKVMPADIHVEDPKSPLAKGLPQLWQRSEEWYSFAENPRKKPGFHIIATVDEKTYTPGPATMGSDHPLIWWHCVGKGHAVYSALGHAGRFYTEPLMLQFLENAIAYGLVENGHACKG